LLTRVYLETHYILLTRVYLETHYILLTRVYLETHYILLTRVYLETHYILPSITVHLLPVTQQKFRNCTESIDLHRNIVFINLPLKSVNFADIFISSLDEQKRLVPTICIPVHALEICRYN